MYIPNRNCREFVQQRREFTGHNLQGVDKGTCYVVYSYNWYPLFVFARGVWYENSQRFSVSTSKQRTQAHPLVDCILKTKDELNNIILNS